MTCMIEQKLFTAARQYTYMKCRKVNIKLKSQIKSFCKKKKKIQ